jgi:hypothetical protein
MRSEELPEAGGGHDPAGARRPPGRRPAEQVLALVAGAIEVQGERYDEQMQRMIDR